ncbi:S8/S53 family peptidase [Haloarcula sp. 1CSR25-25]|uniref:S8/S53 family peptidase n=1 Tax=Haloarcula sp. 1CSR25-25 TaxID=2862545 RepID=UPI00289445FD|nr:S8/S53 family peptidase [Haloarcula sp. 1CSR25-25]MDT3435993.1 S8/S53 family peptidase [Haloarcula sp. 1CSR25-25]
MTFAIVDSGADMAHQAFTDFGIVGRDFTGSDEGIDDTNGHGTHHLGVSVQVAAISSANVRVLVAKVVQYHEPVPWERMNEALLWVTNHNPELVSVGFGAPESTDEFHSTIQRLAEQSLVIAPTGVDRDPSTEQAIYPARFEEVIGVGGTVVEGIRAELDTPYAGCDVLATTPLLGPVPNGGYEKRGGTSIACAVFSGIALRMLATKGRLDMTGKKTSKQALLNRLRSEADSDGIFCPDWSLSTGGPD